MADDPLARFRKSTNPSSEGKAPQPEQANGLQPYEAFSGKDKAKRLEIRRVMGSFQYPAYSYLLNIVADGWHGTEIVLIYSFMSVKIKGRNLTQLVTALKLNECGFIQDYDPRAFAEPSPDAPFIESIEIIAQQGEN